MADMSREPGKIFVAKSDKPEYLTLSLGNRHGLVTGATGTGKTVTLQVLAEGFSRAGVPVFAADIKGDLSGISEPGQGQDFLLKRAGEVGVAYEPDRFPVMFWDIFGEQGTPVRTTVTEMGPLLLARLLSLNEVQEGVLNIAFKLADDEGLLLLDMKDLRSLLAEMVDKADELTRGYGNVTKATIGAIQRQLLVLEEQGGDRFFAEPALDIRDLMRVDRDGRGFISILAADRLMGSPRLYSTFLLWLLSELFEQLPEVGDPDRPKLVFFFDEAHLLFNEAPPALIDKIEQVVRLIRSKGVGVYFVTQNPLDVPDRVLSQLGNRVQHALRAFTPRDQKAVKAAAETFRQNPALDTATVITELGKGEALVSFLEGNGVPSVVQRALIAPPSARLGPVTEQERRATIAASPVRGQYDKAIDRDSAFEVLQRRAEEARAAAEQARQEAEQAGSGSILDGILGGVLGGGAGTGRSPGGRRSTRMTTTEVVVRSVARSMATTAGRQIANAILRGVLGGLSRR